VHDWKNCPAEVEVIELRSVVQKEKGEQAKQELQKDEPIAIKKESTPRVLPDYMKFWDRRMLWVEPATRDLAQHLINRLQIEIPRLIGRPRFRWYSLYRSPPPIRKTECATVLIGRKNVKLSFRVNPRKFSDPDKISKPMAGWFYPKGTERRMTVTAENFEPACRLVKSAVQELD